MAVWGGAKRRGTSNCSASRLIQIRKARLRGKLVSDVLFCFPALRCHVFSPCRSSRCCGAPKPGKEKHKSYDYRSAILMVHGYQSFRSVFTPYCVIFVATLRGKWQEVRTIGADATDWNNRQEDKETNEAKRTTLISRIYTY